MIGQYQRNPKTQPKGQARDTQTTTTKSSHHLRIKNALTIKHAVEFSKFGHHHQKPQEKLSKPSARQLTKHYQDIQHQSNPQAIHQPIKNKPPRPKSPSNPPHQGHLPPKPPPPEPQSQPKRPDQLYRTKPQTSNPRFKPGPEIPTQTSRPRPQPTIHSERAPTGHTPICTQSTRKPITHHDPRRPPEIKPLARTPTTRVPDHRQPQKAPPTLHTFRKARKSGGGVPISAASSGVRRPVDLS